MTWLGWVQDVVALTLLACAPDGRDLITVGDPPHLGFSEGLEDTGLDDAGPLPVRDACYAAPEVLEAPVAVSFCVNVSPEPEQEPPRRCGHYNLVGQLGVAGPPATPTLVYCDSDLDGGTRGATYDPIAGRVSTHPLLPESCPVNHAPAGLIPRRGYLAVVPGWSTEAQDLRVTTIPIDSRGLPDGPARESTLAGVTSATVASGTQTDAAILRLEDQLVIRPIDPSTGVFGVASPIGEAADEVAAVGHGRDVAVVVCGPERTQLMRFGSGLSTVATWASPCGTPMLASDGDVQVLSLRVDGSEWLVFVNDDGTERTRVDLGDALPLRAVTWGGSDFVMVDGRGVISTWSPTGAKLAIGSHPQIPRPDGDVMSLTLSAPRSPTATSSTCAWPTAPISTAPRCARRRAAPRAHAA